MAIDTQHTLDIFGDGSCVALYEFNGNVNDTGGNYNGSDNGISYATGVFGDGAHMDVDKYIEVPVPDSLSSGGWAVSFHINIITLANQFYTINTFTESNQPGRGASIIIPNSGSEIRLAVGGDDVNFSYSTIPFDISGAGYVHLIYTFDGTNRWKVYINGINDPNYDIVKSGNYRWNRPCSVDIGPNIYGTCNPPDNDNVFEIDQLRFFNRGITPYEATILTDEIIYRRPISNSTLSLSASSSGSVAKNDTGFTFAYRIQQAIPVSNFRFAYGIQQSKSSKRIKRVN